MSEKAISVQNVTKVYRIYDNPKDRFREAMWAGKKNLHRDYFALDDLSFDVGKGEIVGIVGRNGSGKSTILKILAGVITPTAGMVSIDGKVAALLELGAGFNPEYTGRRNIYLYSSMMRISHAEIEKKFPDIIRFADIGQYIDQPVKTYSSGMFVRLAFAVAINVDPDVLIVDEALAVGDSRFQLKCMDKFLEFVKAGKTIIYVTHDVNSVKRFCTRAIWINNGKLIMDGNTDEVTDRYMDFISTDMSLEAYLQSIDCKQEKAVDDFMQYDVSGIDIVSAKELHIFNSTGVEIDRIKHGEKVILKVGYLVADESIESPVLGVAIRRIDNEYICGLNTKLDLVSVPWKKGYNSLRLEYENFNLIGGEYYFDVGIFDKTGIVNLDYKTKIKSFFVEMDYIAEGIVVLEHRWR